MPVQFRPGISVLDINEKPIGTVLRVAMAERLRYELINPPMAVAVGFLVGLGNVLFWTRSD